MKGGDTRVARQLAAARARQGKQAPLAQRIAERVSGGGGGGFGGPQKPLGGLRDYQLPSGTGRSFGSVLRGADALSGASSILRGIAGATTGMGSVRNPRDLLGREANAAAALAGVAPGGGGQAVALGPRIVKLRNVLGLPKGGAGIRAAREMNELADMPMLPLTKDIRDLLEKVLPDTGQGVKRGGAHRVPAQSKHGQFVTDRTAIIQDPETGTMFAAPGTLHADLIDYVTKHHPEFARGPQGYLQHEVYAGAPAFAKGQAPVPPRVMLEQNAHRDTPAATIARARLLDNLQKLGVVGNVAEQRARRESMLRGTRSAAFDERLGVVRKKKYR